MKFKVGDWVKITKPIDLMESPGWNPYIDLLLNRPVQIKSIANTYGWYKIDGWTFKEEWLISIKDYKNPTHEEKIIKKIHELDTKWKEKQQQKKGNLCA